MPFLSTGSFFDLGGAPSTPPVVVDMQTVYSAGFAPAAAGSHTLVGVDLGAPDPDRVIIALFSLDTQGGAARSLSTLTINGVSATRHVANPDTGTHVFATEIWTAPVPNDATGDVFFNWGGSSHPAIAAVQLIRAVGLPQEAPNLVAESERGSSALSNSVPAIGPAVVLGVFHGVGTGGAPDFEASITPINGHSYNGNGNTVYGTKFISGSDTFDMDAAHGTTQQSLVTAAWYCDVVNWSGPVFVDSAASHSLIGTHNVVVTAGTTLTTIVAGASLGAADASRLIVVPIAFRASGAARTIAEMTIGGVSATLGLRIPVTTVDPGFEIWYANVPSGTTGGIRIRASSNSIAREIFAVYRVVDASQLTAVFGRRNLITNGRVNVAGAKDGVWIGGAIHNAIAGVTLAGLTQDATDLQTSTTLTATFGSVQLTAQELLAMGANRPNFGAVHFA